MIDTVLHGDALIELRKLEDNSIDALVCDPPAGISFMNKAFDHDRGGRKQWIEWLCSIMQEVYRVLKPGAHGLVWALPRTSHWTACALEDAGFEIRDCVYHLYSKHDKLQAFMGSLSDEQRVVFETLMEDDGMRLHLFGAGFPKSHNVSVAIDKLLGKEREVIGTREDFVKRANKLRRGDSPFDNTVHDGSFSHPENIGVITAPATPLAQQYSGFGSALKPSVECWWLIRKPLSESSIARNVLKWGTGALNIDATRIEYANEKDAEPKDYSKSKGIGTLQEACKAHGARQYKDGYSYLKNDFVAQTHPTGRWPSHLLMTHSLLCNDEQCSEYCPIAILDKQSGTSKSISSKRGGVKKSGVTYSSFDTSFVSINESYECGYNDKGGASRYFAQFQPDAPFIYAPKASRRERSLGCEALPGGKGPVMNDRCVNCGKGRLDGRRVGACCDNPQYEKQAPSGNVQNNHPTVKSQQLMRYMLKLVVPPNGVVLDCFAGSGSTLVAAVHEGFHYIGVEAEAEYIEIINARLEHAHKQVHGDPSCDLWAQ